jgi:hypothetical protein
MFASWTRARAIQTRAQLAAGKKKGTPTAEYFRQMKTLADSLAAIGQPLREDEIIAYILAGLDNDYDILVTTLTVKDDITLDEVYAHLLAYEHRHDLHESEYGLGGSASVNLSHRGSGSHGNSGGNSSGGGQGSGQGGGNYSGGRSNGGGYRGRGQGRNGGGRGQGQGRGNHGCGNNSNDDHRPVCQICGKIGHAALRCHRRFDHAFTGEEHSVNVASTSYNYNADPSWHMDTGATDHITNDLDRLHIRERYNSNEQVHVGNGEGLHISHVGHSTINTNANPLQFTQYPPCSSYYQKPSFCS